MGKAWFEEHPEINKEFEDLKILENYFKKGYWTSDFEGNKKITEAKVGSKVYFQIEMNSSFPELTLPELKKNIIKFTVYAFDGNNVKFKVKVFPLMPDYDLYPIRKDTKIISFITWDDINNNNKLDKEEFHTKKKYNHIEVKDLKATLIFNLKKPLYTYFNQFNKLKIFIHLSYNNTEKSLPINESDYLNIKRKTPIIKDIYVQLLNFKVPSKLTKQLSVIGNIQTLEGQNDKQSDDVNLDYFSVKIKKLPDFAEGDIRKVYKEIRNNFLTLSKGSKKFTSKVEPVLQDVKGSWEFKPYILNEDDGVSDDRNYSFYPSQLDNWANEKGGAIFLIKASADKLRTNLIADSGAVLESESIPSEMCWLFTTIFTNQSDTQPFSGHRQFGIHKDDDGDYRFYARAIDRVRPSEVMFLLNQFDEKDALVEDYLTIADATWVNLIKKVSEFIVNNGGETKIMKPEIIRTKFKDFLIKYKKKSISKVGNIPQFKIHE